MEKMIKKIVLALLVSGITVTSGLLPVQTRSMSRGAKEEVVSPAPVAEEAMSTQLPANFGSRMDNLTELVSVEDDDQFEADESADFVGTNSDLPSSMITRSIAQDNAELESIVAQYAAGLSDDYQEIDAKNIDILMDQFADKLIEIKGLASDVRAKLVGVIQHGRELMNAVLNDERVKSTLRTLEGNQTAINAYLTQVAQMVAKSVKANKDVVVTTALGTVTFALRFSNLTYGLILDYIPGVVGVGYPAVKIARHGVRKGLTRSKVRFVKRFKRAEMQSEPEVEIKEEDTSK